MLRKGARPHVASFAQTACFGFGLRQGQMGHVPPIRASSSKPSPTFGAPGFAFQNGEVLVNLASQVLLRVPRQHSTSGCHALDGQVPSPGSSAKVAILSVLCYFGFGSGRFGSTGEDEQKNVRGDLIFHCCSTHFKFGIVEVLHDADRRYPPQLWRPERASLGVQLAQDSGMASALVS